MPFASASLVYFCVCFNPSGAVLKVFRMPSDSARVSVQDRRIDTSIDVHVEIGSGDAVFLIHLQLVCVSNMYLHELACSVLVLHKHSCELPY